ncbi:MAG TPA: HipA family kinase, partial [Candidatus Kapabacteria bacterium]
SNIDMLPQEMKQCIFLFDSFFLNIDRTARNTNIITSDEGVFVTDMGASLLPSSIITGTRFGQNAKVIEQLTRHPFFADYVDISLLTDRLSMILEKDISTIVSAIPSIWLDKPDDRIRLSEGLINSFRDSESFSGLMSNIKTIPRLSEEEVRRRNAVNRVLFDERLDK